MKLVAASVLFCLKLSHASITPNETLVDTSLYDLPGLQTKNINRIKEGGVETVGQKKVKTE